MPLYQLLGGASRTGVMVYCHTTGHSIDEALDDYAKHVKWASRRFACSAACRE